MTNAQAIAQASEHESHRARFARRLLSGVKEVRTAPPMQGCFWIGLVIVVVVASVLIAADALR
jgi:hypothetical protein